MGSNRVFRQIVVPLSTILTIVLNGAASAGRLNGYATGEISDLFPNLFVPAGYVFAIWLVIYIALVVYSVWQALPAQLSNPRLQSIAPLYVLSGVLNVIWLVTFHFFQFGLALVLMVGLLITLIAIYLRLRTTDAPSSERWFARVPFSIYLGWITVATIANATQLLVSLNWNGFGIAPEVWTVLMIGAAVVVALLMFLTQRDAAYLLVLVWAIAGIGVKQAAVPAVATAAWVAVVVIAAMAVISLIPRRGAPLSARPA